MTKTLSYGAAWQLYRDAMNDLYTAPANVVGTADRSTGEIYAEQLEERGDTVLARAEDVRVVLTESLHIESLEQRELATLKLFAAAAYDLSVANDLIEMEAAGPAKEPERSARSAILAAKELRDILEAPLEQGMSGLQDTERAILPKDLTSARAYLEKTVSIFIATIPSEAAGLSQTAVSGAVNLGLGPAQEALSLATQEILARLPEGASMIVRRVASLVVEAIKKLRAAIGEDGEKQARGKVKTWLDDVREKRETVESLLDKLYETTLIEKEVTTALSSASAVVSVNRYNAATRTLEMLMSRYNQTKAVLEWTMRLLAVIKNPLLAAVPWGPISLYSSYAGVLAYAVYSGGDYLDWYRTGEYQWLDRVQGLRTTVQQALDGRTEEAEPSV